MTIVPVPAEELNCASDLLHMLILYTLYEHSIKGLFRTKHGTHTINPVCRMSGEGRCDPYLASQDYNSKSMLTQKCDYAFVHELGV